MESLKAALQANSCCYERQKRGRLLTIRFTRSVSPPPAVTLGLDPRALYFRMLAWAALFTSSPICVAVALTLV